MRFSIFRSVKSEFKDVKEMDKQRVHRHRMVHIVMKQKVIVPILKFMYRRFANYLIKDRSDIPDELYNKNLLILWDAIEEGNKEWWFKYKGIDDKMVSDAQMAGDIKQWQEKEKSTWYQIPNLFMRFYATIWLEDTAYREQGNVFMYKLYEKMAKEYGDKPIVHPFYVVHYDYFLPYFIEWMKYKGVSGDVTLHIEAKENYTPHEPTDVRQFIDFAIMMEERIKDERRIREAKQAGSGENNQAKSKDAGNLWQNGRESSTSGTVSGSVSDKAGKAGKARRLPKGNRRKGKKR